MFKPSLVFIIFLGAAAAICFYGRAAVLFFYLLFPLLLFPTFYFFERQTRFFFIGALCLDVTLYGVFLFHHRSIEMLAYFVGLAGLLAGLVVYKKKWEAKAQLEARQNEDAWRELEALKQKHHSRLESLHHLEKQVASLLDLFEIARDFGEYLTLDRIVEILFKKVKPELPFERMALVLSDKSVPLPQVARKFEITSEGIRQDDSTVAVTADEAEAIEKVRSSKQIVQHEARWFFGISSEADTFLIVERAQPDDLAKFEVLAAYLTLQIKKARLYETVRELSIRDGLTGVFVRRHFLERFIEELKRSLKFNLSLAVLMLDIDHFKRYNDDYGHLTGDATLKQVAALLIENLRKVDIVARYGGEEFVMVIPETRGEGALEVAERIRSNIARHNFRIYQDDTRVTVSIGAALFPSDVSKPDRVEDPSQLAFELIQNADKALYRAKEEGRNRVILFQDL